MKRDTTQLIISLGFASLLVLIFIVAYISLSEMNSTIKQMEEVVKVTNGKIASAHTMRDYVRLRADTLNKMYLTDDFFERDEIAPMLAHYAAKYREARDELTSYGMTKEEEMLHQKILDVSEIGFQVNNIALDILMSDVPIEEVRYAMREANIGRQRVLDHLDKLVEIQNKNAQLALDESIKINQQTRKIVITISILSFFLGIAISIYVVLESLRKNREMHFQAHHDALTSLYNRKEFEARLQYVIDKAKLKHTEHALCFMDLDQFKIINDTCGHKAGDQMLIELSRLIQAKIRDNDTLGRLGGDEFGLLLEKCTLNKAIEIAEGLVNLVKKYEFKWDDRTFRVGVSIGLVHITNKSRDATSLMSEADIACYAAKDMGRNRVHVHAFNDEHVKKIHQELSWVADIETSLKDQRFKLYAQPIIPVDPDTKVRSMFEILLRLKDDAGNIISPGAYIPAAERFGLMRAVDIWVVAEVIKMIEVMNKSGQLNKPLVFINLSANSLIDIGFCDYVLALLKDHNIPDDSICFEITETAAIKNIQQAKDFMWHLKKAHCLFALDDFGAGMSSFSYLKNLPVDYLKIDGSFVNKMDENTVDQAMVAAIHQIGQVMSIQTIAEHVENEATMTNLKDIGVTYAQGYHICKPMAINELVETTSQKQKTVG
jgi:diguanylate cyclase (GGDEF)-like protein